VNQAAAVVDEQLSDNERLLEAIGAFFRNPLGYIYYTWEWGEQPALRVCKTPKLWRDRLVDEMGFTPERTEYGIDEWFCHFIDDLESAIKNRGFNPDLPATVMPVEMATRSGHGIGKSAGVGILSSFLLDTRPGARGMITANTGPQLFTKTWPQVKKWKTTAITAHWWRVLESRIVHVFGESHGSLDAVTWKKEASEAFAGQHAVDASSFYIFDEASAIADPIWEVSRGGLTDGEPFHFSFGNPTRNTGEFHKCFGRRRAQVLTREVDSRDVQITNKELFAQWIEEYGLHSDFVRVRVLGKEPKAGEQQLIPVDLVEKAMSRDIPMVEDDEPIVMSIDCARSPLGDESVIFVRRGLDARTFGMRCFRGKDTHQLASLAASWCNDLQEIGHPVDIILVDGGGLGAGTLDRLTHLGFPTVEVLFGGKADNETRFKQKDAEMWSRALAWLKLGGALPDDPQLEEQLCARPHDHTDDNRLYLWPKDKCKEDLGIESPDRADAFCAGFAFFAARKARIGRGNVQAGRCVTAAEPDF